MLFALRLNPLCLFCLPLLHSNRDAAAGAFLFHFFSLGKARHEFFAAKHVHEKMLSLVACSTLGLAAGVKAEPHPYLRPGRRVRVIRGPLAGMDGTLVRRKERFHLVLSIELIMRSVLLEVDEADVRAI